MRNLIFSALILATVFQTALGQTYTSGDYQYTLSNNQATITRYAAVGVAVVIPSNLNSYPVVSIGSYAFQYTSLTSVIIPNSVTSIGDAAFYYCLYLTYVSIGNSVASIGDLAFAWCPGLTSLTIPNSVTSIGENAFAFAGLTSVTIPSSVTSIGSYAFELTPLGSVFLSSTTTFPSNAFPPTAVFYYGSTTPTEMATQADFATIQADLASTKAELAEIKTDLANTKTDLSSYFAKFPKSIKIHLPRSPWSKEKK